MVENMNLEWILERRGGSLWWRGRWRRRTRWWSWGRPRAPGSSRRSSRLQSPVTSERNYGQSLSHLWDTRVRPLSRMKDRQLAQSVSKKGRWPGDAPLLLASTG